MSRLPFELMLALRYLRPKRTFVSVITLISIVGVMLGVAVLIIVIAVMTGFDRQLRDKLVGFTPHILIERPNGTLGGYEAVMQRVATNDFVEGVAPLVMGQVMVKTQPLVGNPRFLVPMVRGVDPVNEPHVSRLLDSVIAGTNSLRGYSVLLGSGLADSLQVSVGDRLAMYSVRQFEEWDSAHREGTEEAPLADDFRVNGIFDVGFYEFDSMFLLTSLANAQDLYNLSNSVHGVMVALKDPDEAMAAARELFFQLGPQYRVTTWMEERGPLLEALVVEKNMMFYLLFFITIVAAFGICSAQITFVVQKTREIGTLKAVGATSGQIMWLFLGQSLVVGVVGVAAGFGLGMLAVTYRNEFLYFMRDLTGLELFPANIYLFRELPALVVPGDIAIIAGGSLVICLLAGLIPAWNAGRLKPVEALRHE
ncbi:MAG: ABC transporter permease [Verrucomicrobiales bacterium]|nr:ABC transporter permease [Verrucomicrobiales bacterium]